MQEVEVNSYVVAAAQLEAVRADICEREVALMPHVAEGGYLSPHVNRRMKLLKSQVRLGGAMHCAHCGWLAAVAAMKLLRLQVGLSGGSSCSCEV
jgi:hypothetical protein